MKDPNNPLYGLGSNYYRNNFGVIRGLDEDNYHLKKFPLFKLIMDLKIENGFSSNSQQQGSPSTKADEKMKAFTYKPKIRQASNEKRLSQIRLEDEEDIGKYQHYSKSPLVNLCRFILDRERNL